MNTMIPDYKDSHVNSMVTAWEGNNDNDSANTPSHEHPLSNIGSRCAEDHNEFLRYGKDEMHFSATNTLSMR